MTHSSPGQSRLARNRPARQSRGRSRYTRNLFFEQLETRALLTTVTELDILDIAGNVGEKPESKLWEHNDTWFGVLSNDAGSFVWRLDGTSWTPVFKLPSSTAEPARADVKVVGDVTHVLLEDDTNTKLVSLQYVSGSPGTYELWDARPTLADVELAVSVEAATIDIDSTGRMWVAYDNNANNEGKIQTRYSDVPYDDWSAPPITLASNVRPDDISVVTALPNQTIGVMWSDQNAKLFGFRVHVDGDNPLMWSPDETPASQSALDIGQGMADDHINLAVAPDSTLYAAVKTSYGTTGLPQVALLVRRPNGVWDDLYDIGDKGSRPGVWLNTANDHLIYTYEKGDFFFRECPTSTLTCGPAQIFVTNGKNASSTKQNVTDDLVLVASGADVSGMMWGAHLTFDVPNHEVPEAQTISFQDGIADYSGTRDTKLRSDHPEENFGSGKQLQLDGNPDFSSGIKWDVSAIPADAKVISASITVNVIRESNDTFEIYEALRPWVEEAATFIDAARGVAWEVPGAQGPSDRGETVLGEISAPVIGHVTVELNEAGRALIQDWIADPASNYGIILQDYDNASTDELGFESREADNVADRPRLEVAYTTPPATSSWLTNPENQYDVNGDSVVSPVDVLVIINDLLTQRSLLNAATDEPGTDRLFHYLDVSGDGLVAPNDALLVINYLNERVVAGGEAEALSVFEASSNPRPIPSLQFEANEFAWAHNWPASFRQESSSDCDLARATNLTDPTLAASRSQPASVGMLYRPTIATAHTVEVTQLLRKENSFPSDLEETLIAIKETPLASQDPRAAVFATWRSNAS